MPFDVPSLDEMTALLVADYRNRFPNADLSRFSDNYKRLRTTALGITDLHAHVDEAWRDLMPDSAEGEALTRLAEIHGLTRKSATPARRSDALRVFAAAGGFVPPGAQLSSKGGLIFAITDGGTVVSGTFADFDVVGVDVGAQTRLLAGDVLTFVSPPSGIQAAAELQLDLDQDGEDEESDGALRARLLARIAQPGMGGNANDFVQWALEVTGVASAYCYSGRQGLGSVDVVGLHAGDGAVRVLSAGEKLALLDHLNARRPVSIADFRVLDIDVVAQNVELAIREIDDPAYRRDWTDSTPPVVTSWAPSTRVLTFVDDRPDDMLPGDRLVFRSTVAPFGTGAQHVIEELSSTDAVILQAGIPGNPPVATNLVFSGGPIIDAIRDEVLAMVSKLGPARGAFAAHAWEDSVLISALYKIAQLAIGVRNTTIVAPTSDVVPTDPTFPDDDATNLLVPGQVIVRYL